MTDAWAVAAALVATAVLIAVAPVDEVGFLLQGFGAGTVVVGDGGTLVNVFRVVLAGLVLLSGLPLGGLAGEWDPWGQFALVMGLMFAVSFVLPHYFYRGEPLLPKRRQRR